LRIQHVLLALLVVVIWGCNFNFIKFGLEEMSPLLLCAVRFFLASLPAIFFIKRPAVPFKIVAIYGLLTFGLQFSLLFLGMNLGVPPGLASLIAQVQVFFSILFAVMILDEAPNLWQIIGALISFSGIATVAFHVGGEVSFAGLMLILAAAAAWGYGNLVTKKVSSSDTMGLVVWASFVASFPLLICSLLFEGTQSIVYSYHHLTWLGFSSILYIVYASTWVGYGVWNWLLNRYSVATVVPFTLLVPIVGMISSVLITGESFHPWKIVSAVLVIMGLCVNLLGARLFMKKIST
jgi:O-acetylserine/cysteine efflux transporter